MKLRKNKENKICWTFTKPRIAVWCLVLVVCIAFSALVLSAPGKIQREWAKVDCQELSFAPYALEPGSTMVQEFRAQGQTTGGASHLYLNIFRQEGAAGNLTVRLFRERKDELLADITCDFEELPACADLEAAAAEARTIYETTESQRPAPEEMPAALTTPVMLGDGYFLLRSGEYYRLEITNNAASERVYLLGNPQVQSGKLTVDGETQEGFLNLSWMRQSLYNPSVLLPLMVLLADATVLLGLALVLFTDVKVHVLYLILAVGFGLVTLFDLTPIYGFDMRFQFDSAYVLSNRLMGIDGYYWVADAEDPNGGAAYYSRRYCDDYSQYQFYKADEVSANYTDMKAGLRNLTVTEEEQEMIWVKADLGFISTQLYMYLPQAIGFAVARLLGLGMYPMLQLARALSYAVFVGTMYFAIRKVPFGKLIFLVSALIPTVMVQMVSLTRDAMIICLGFYITAAAIKMAYGSQKPGKWEWIKLAAASMLLAPCKLVYLPLSCLFLLVVYRQYILPAGDRGKRLLKRLVLAGAGAVMVLITANLWTIYGLLFESGESIYGSESYTVGLFFTQPLQALELFINTFRIELGGYLVNAVQLFDIELGCNDGITLLVLGALLMSCCVEERQILRREKCFMFLAASGVLVLTALASMRWTPIGSDVIVGLQGRYLTPVLPVLCMAMCGNKVLKGTESASVLVKISCCIFPALSLMNMYLWAVQL